MSKDRLLWGCHWYTEGDVKFIVNAQNLKDACNKFLDTELKLIQEVEPDESITHTVIMSRSGQDAIVEIYVGQQYVVKGEIHLVKNQNIPILLSDFVKTSIHQGAVTQIAVKLVEPSTTKPSDPL